MQANQRIFKELCEDLKATKPAELMELHGTVLDWMRVSDKMQAAAKLPNDSMLTVRQIAAQLSPTNCIMYYKHALDDTVAKHEFTPAECHSLEKTVERAGGYDWDAIAKSLQTGRNAWQCFRQHLARTGPFGKVDDRFDWYCDRPALQARPEWLQAHGGSSARCVEHAFRYVLW